VLITGGAGFIGSHLVKSLVKKSNFDLVVLDNLVRGRLDLLRECSENIRFIHGDVRDRECVTEATRGIDIVFHLAAQSNVVGAGRNIDYSFTTNVVGTFEVLKAAKANGVGRVVFASSREVYGDAASLPVPEEAPLAAKNAYGASKIAGEAYCRVFSDAAMGINILRLANVYGPGDRDRVIPLFLEAAKRSDPIIIYGGRQLLDFIWVDEVVKALHVAAFGPQLPGPINLGSGVGIAIRSLAERVLHSMNKQTPIRIEPAREFETVRFVADISQARELLGFRPPEDPLFALQGLADLYRPNAHDPTNKRNHLLAQSQD